MPDPELRTISASQAAALVGAHPYMTRWMLAQHLMGNRVPRPDDNRMAWGRLMQSMLLSAAMNDLHLEIKPNTDDAYVRRGLLGCTLDGTIVAPDLGPGAIETKCCFDYTVWREQWGGGKHPPKHVEIQLQTQMLVGDGTSPYRWGVIAVWCAAEMFYFKREPLPELWAVLEKEATELLADVAAGNPGDPIGHPIELPLINQLFSPKPGITLDLTDHPQAQQLAEKTRMLKWHGDERKGHEKGERALKAELTALAGEAEEVILPGGVRLRQKLVERAAYHVAPTRYVTLTPYVPTEPANLNQQADNPLMGG